jgi:hypothetical protein
MKVLRTAPLLLALCLSAAGPASGATKIRLGDVEPTGAPNAAYLDAAGWRGLQTEIVYLRPDAPLPEGAVAVTNAPGVADTRTERRNWAIAAGVVLMLVLAFVAWYGRGVSIAFGAPRDPLRRGSKWQTDARPVREVSTDALLAELAAMPDRRQALITMVTRALERAAQANGLRLGRAQTARDVLRVLPPRWPHFDSLRWLISEAELVHYGGRDLAEERWRACLDQARPLFAAEKAR